MKKTIISLFLIMSLTSIFGLKLSVSTDLGAVQDLIIKTGTYRVSAECRCSVSEKFSLRIPFAVSLGQETSMFDTGVFLDYRPWQNQGLFVGLSLVQFGLINGDTNLDKNFYGLNEIDLGWTFCFSGFTLEPALAICDPSGTFTDEYELINGVFPCNRKFRFKLSTGWTFDIGRNQGDLK